MTNFEHDLAVALARAEKAEKDLADMMPGDTAVLVNVADLAAMEPILRRRWEAELLGNAALERAWQSWIHSSNEPSSRVALRDAIRAALNV